MDESTVSRLTSSDSCPACHADLACRLCHDLLECKNYIRGGATLVHQDWLVALRAGSCQRCNIVSEILKKISPQILDEHGIYSGSEITISPRNNRNGLVFIKKARDGIIATASVFQIHSPQEPTIGNAHAFRDLAQNPGEESTWQFLRQCLSFCLRMHQKCHAHYDSEWMPKRLLLLDSKEGVPGRIRLVDTQEHFVTGRYAALSYVWGKGPKLLAIQQTLATLRSGIDQAELPATMSDCVTVGVQLGIQFVWINALCIMQDDKDDWAIQSQQMSRVFENALFVVAACSSPNTSTPFLGPHAPNTRPNSTTFALSSLRESSNYVRARNVRRLLRSWYLEGPFERRGWTWQERKLSTRTMNFASTQVVWNCKEAAYYEHGIITDDEGSPWSMEEETSSGTTTDEDLSPDAWRRHIRDYSPRELTYATDRLPAVSGMAARFHAVRQCDYYAGLWADEFPYCLGWFYDHFHGPPTLIPDEILLALHNDAPSWSWASIRGRVRWSHWVPEPRFRKDNAGDTYPLRIEADSKLLEADCKPATHNQFGEVLAGSFLRLRGKVVEALMECDGFGRGFVRREGFAPQLVQPDCLLGLDRTLLIDDLATPTQDLPLALGRANQAESDYDPSLRIQGNVLCMLLYTFFDNVEDEDCPFVLILCEAGANETSYKRVAAGTGDYCPDDKNIKAMEQWEGCTGVENWENWENWREWFADAKTRDICIL